MSPAFVACIELARHIAQFDIPVLLEGETGTGKEVIARHIYLHSPRRNRAFVSINCAALPGELMESEFFGHCRGAFTHAVSDRSGYVAEAHGGILFLDEISSLDLSLQAKLLRFLQEGEYRQVGAARAHSADVRVIAASNEPLTQVADRGRFRWDLFYRLDVFRLRLPALRERSGDVPLLVEHFLDLYGRQFRQPPPRLSCEAMGRLEAGTWPGNVRQLQNLCQRLVIQFPGRRVGSAELASDGLASWVDGKVVLEAGAASFKEQKAEVIRHFEVTYLRRLLARHDGNMSRAARSAGKHRRALLELLRKHDISPEEFRPSRNLPPCEDSAQRLSDPSARGRT